MSTIYRAKVIKLIGALERSDLTTVQAMKRCGLSRSATFAWLKAFQRAVPKLAHVAEWRVRKAGGYEVVWAWGNLPDVPRPPRVPPAQQRRAARARAFQSRATRALLATNLSLGHTAPAHGAQQGD